MTASAAATAMTKKTDHLAVGGAEIARKSDESQVDGVEHELDGHENDDQITPDQHAEHADGKDHRAQNQIVMQATIM